MEKPLPNPLNDIVRDYAIEPCMIPELYTKKDILKLVDGLGDNIYQRKIDFLVTLLSHREIEVDTLDFLLLCLPKKLLCRLFDRIKANISIEEWEKNFFK